jgi:hypothetical protein
MSFNYQEKYQSLKKQEKEISEIGKNHGIEESPVTADINFNATQFDIRFQCQSIVRELISDSKISISNYANQLNSYEAVLETEVTLPDLNNMISSSRQEITSFLAKEEPIYIDRKIEFWQAEKNINLFKREKGIQDGPIKAPDSQKAHYTTLIAYGVIETIINVFIFNGGLSGPDALLLSFFITILNIFPSVVIGNYFRNIHIENTAIKYFSLLITGFWLLFLIWLNTSISIFRSYLTEFSQSNNLGGFTSSDLFSNPHIAQIFFHDSFMIFLLQAPEIKDVLSVFLWLVGILAGLIAAWKGYTADEKIPELGDLNRDFESKKEASNLIEQSLRLQLSTIHSKNLDIFKTIKIKLDQNRRDYISCAQMLNQKVIEFEQNIGNIKDEYIHLINVYRDSNKSTRKSPPPSYFEEREPDLDIRDLPDFSEYKQEKSKDKIANIEKLHSEKIASINDMQNEFNKFIDEMNLFFEEKISSFDLKASQAMIRPW